MPIRPPFTWCLLALTMMFGGASLLNLGSAYDPLDPAFSVARFILIAGGLAALLPFLPGAIANFKLNATAGVLISLWLMFGAVSLISSVATNDQMDGIASSLWVFLGVPLIFFVGLPGVLGGNANKLVVLALLITHSLYIAISLSRYPDLHFEYKGIFGHANGTGVTAAVVAVSCLAWIVEHVQTRSFPRLGGSILVMLFGASCFLIMVSGSRTSLLAVLVTTAVAVLLCAKQLYRRQVLPPLAAGVTLLVAGAAFLPNLGFAEQIWQKHTQRVEMGDVLSQRDEIWLKVVDDMHLLGNGGDYFPETVGISSHNSLMHILGQRGPVAAFLMTCIAAFAMRRAFGQASPSTDRISFSATPALIAVCFWALSMGEAMFGSLGSGITLAYQLSLGILLVSDTTLSTTDYGAPRHLVSERTT